MEILSTSELWSRKAAQYSSERRRKNSLGSDFPKKCFLHEKEKKRKKKFHVFFLSGEKKRKKKKKKEREKKRERESAWADGEYRREKHGNGEDRGGGYDEYEHEGEHKNGGKHKNIQSLGTEENQHHALERKPDQ